MSIAGAALNAGRTTVTGGEETPAAQLERVFGHTADALYRFIRVRVAGRRDVADDLLQQTCCVVAQRTRTFSDDGECEAWMKGIARNLIKSYWRRERKANGRIDLENAEQSRRWLERMESEVVPESELSNVETVARMVHAITELPAADQKLVFDVYFGGLSHAEVSNELGVSTKAIESRLYRIRERLRALLDKKGLIRDVYRTRI